MWMSSDFLLDRLRSSRLLEDEALTERSHIEIIRRTSAILKLYQSKKALTNEYADFCVEFFIGSDVFLICECFGNFVNLPEFARQNEFWFF